MISATLLDPGATRGRPWDVSRDINTGLHIMQRRSQREIPSSYPSGKPVVLCRALKPLSSVRDILALSAS